MGLSVKNPHIQKEFYHTLTFKLLLKSLLITSLFGGYEIDSPARQHTFQT